MAWKYSNKNSNNIYQSFYRQNDSFKFYFGQTVSHVGSSSLTGTQTCAPQIGAPTTGHQASPNNIILGNFLFYYINPSAVMMTLWDLYFQFPHFTGGKAEAGVHLETCTHCEPRLKKYNHVDARIFLLVHGSDGLPLTPILSWTLCENCKTPLSVIFKLWVLIP